MTAITADDVRRQIQDGTLSTGAIDGSMFDSWLSRERENAVSREMPCDGGCNTNDGPEETCSRHGRPVAQVWDMQQAAAREAARLQAAVDSVLELHAPMDALNVRYGQTQQVCIACGTDDGNWQVWPCPTVRLIKSAVPASTTGSETVSATREGLCDQANGMLLSGAFPLLQECALPAGHRRQQAHRNEVNNTAWRQPDLEGVELARAKAMREVLARELAAGNDAPWWALDLAAPVTPSGDTP